MGINITKHNHYNPRGYLTGFSNASDNSIYRFDKSTMQYVQGTPYSLGKQSKLYSQKFEDKLARELDAHFPDLIKRFEQYFVKGKDLNFETKDFGLLSRFIAIQPHRTPTAKDIVKRAYTEIPQLKELPNMQLTEQYQKQMERSAAETVNSLQNFELTMLMSSEDNPFITSDNVVTLFRREDKIFSGYSQAYLDEGTRLLFPISSKLCLLRGDPITLKKSEIKIREWKLEEDMVKFFNSLIAGNAVTYIYGNNQKVIAEAINASKNHSKCTVA